MPIPMSPRNFDESSLAEDSSKEHFGTCLWIGDHQTRWTRELFDQCVAGYAQVAVRSNIPDAVDRHCQAVTRILNVRVDSREWNRDELELLASRHPTARLMDIRGPLCESFYRFADPLFHDGHHTWLTAAGALDVLGDRPQPRSTITQHARTKVVLVVAPDFGTASPLIAAASAANFSATWVRHPHPECVTGIDEVWWHDASLGTFSVSTAYSNSSSIRHILVSTSRPSDATMARFDAVVHLPGSLRSLIGNPQVLPSAHQAAVVRRAA